MIEEISIQTRLASLYASDMYIDTQVSRKSQQTK